MAQARRNSAAPLTPSTWLENQSASLLAATSVIKMASHTRCAPRSLVRISEEDLTAFLAAHREP
jgi:hypothetical protein